MAKHTKNVASKDRPIKKARIELPVQNKIQVKSPRFRKIFDQGTETEITGTSKIKAKGKAYNAQSQLPTSFKIVAGSYEKLLYGLDGTITLDENSKLKIQLEASFIFPAHVSCIKAVAASPQGGKWLATGSADEIVKVWDLRRRKEIGGLMHHEGSITHLIFPSRSHLLSASEDGTLCLFRARDWSVLRSLRGHKGRVNAVAVHPSGKVALSVGKDRALRMWDLMRGKGVASTKLGKEGEIVRWSTDGSKFLVQSGSSMDVYGTNMDLKYTIIHPSRIHDAKFCSRVGSEGELLFVTAEDHKLSVYDVPKEAGSPTIIAEMVGHTNRVKAVQTMEIALPESSGRTSTTIACTVSSDGFINIYDIAAVPGSSEPTLSGQVKQIEPLTSYDSKGTRLTCVTLADGDLGVMEGGDVKRKRGDDDDGENVVESGQESETDEENNSFGADSEDEIEDGEAGTEDEEECD